MEWTVLLHQKFVGTAPNVRQRAAQVLGVSWATIQRLLTQKGVKTAPRGSPENHMVCEPDAKTSKEFPFGGALFL